MQPSEKNREERRFSDIHSSEDGRLARMRVWKKGWGNVVNLKPRISRRHPILAAFVLIFGAGLLFFGVQRLFTRAEVADFFPSTCLGTWTNVQNAQGRPENLNASPSSTFNGANSATLDGGEGQIFCGGFLPSDYPAVGDIKNVGITFVWQAGESSSSFPVISSVPDPVFASSTGEEFTVDGELPPVSLPSSSPEEVVNGAQEVESQIETPTNETTTPDTSFIRFFKNNIFPVAFADDSTGVPLSNTTTISVSASSSPVVEEASPPPPITEMPETSSTSIGAEPVPSEPATTTPDREGETIILGPSISASLTPVATTSDVLSPEFIEGQLQAGFPSTDSASSPQASSGNNVAPDEHFLKVSYSTNGRDWIEVAKVRPDNWQNLTVTLPLKNWSDLARIQIAVETIPTELNPIPKVFLDGMFLEVHYDVPPVFASGGGAPSASTQTLPSPTPAPAAPTVIIDVSSDQKPLPVEPGKGTFRADEAPQFNFDLNTLPAPIAPEAGDFAPHMEQPAPAPTSFLRRTFARIGFFLSFFRFEKFANAQSPTPPAGDIPTAQNPIVAKVLDPENRPSNIEPIIIVSNNKLRVSVPEPKTNFRPGRYKLQLWILQNGTIYYTENDFTWGVLVVNFNKTIYTTGNTARIGFGVLNDRGETICDAEIEMTISSPSGKIFNFRTEPLSAERSRSPSTGSGDNGSGSGSDNLITRSSTCGPQTVTNEPDYSASLPARAIGHYSVVVTAETANGVREIADGFDVANEPAFDVERSAPTRIYPPATYKTTITVRANRDFKGTITETVPNSFQTFTAKFAAKSFTPDTQSMSWSVDMKKGEKVELVYFFDAPDVSPELYKLGPLRIGTWAETRKWQIASDAPGEIILLWPGSSATIPSGWTCITCSSSTTFQNVFPRASSTFGNASTSVNSVVHTASSSATGGGAASGATANGSAVPADSHTHSINNFNAASSSNNIVPSYLGLNFIKAATTTLPNGIIGMFEVSSSSLPANWTWYSPINNRYLRGGDGNASSTGGTEEHTHSFSTSTTAASNGAGTASGGSQQSVGGASHTHGVSGNLLNASNTPPYVTVVFARLTTTSTIPNKLVAMFDSTSLPDGNWNIVSTSGSKYAGRLLLGSDVFGTQGGTATHQHAATATSTASISGTTTSKNGGSATALSDGGHTHAFTITSAPSSSVPIHRDIILAKFTAGNTAPVVSGVVLNHNNPIILTPNATTSFDINYTVQDDQDCTDIANTTSTAFRGGVSASCAVPNPTTDNLNCYLFLTHTTSSCSATTFTATDTVHIYYFAQSTGDASSSFPSDTWYANARAIDSAGTTSSATSSNVNVQVLLALNITTSTVTYGTVMASSTTGDVNQSTTIQNVGNASQTLKIYGTALTFNSNIIATSSQHYATSSFTFGGSEQVLNEVAQTVSGFLLTTPTSTNAVSSPIFWGITIPSGNVTGTYSGTNVFTAFFSP